MTDTELFTFMAVFRGLLQVFPKRMDEHEISQMGGTYFKALKRFTVPQAAAGADAWTQRGKFFPKPAEWIDAIPRASAVQPIAELTAFERADYLEAESFGFEQPPCGCGLCREAGVSDRPRRFVPNEDEERGRIGERIVMRGHWAHGFELARWHVAHDRFWAEFRALATNKTMPPPKALPQLKPVHSREPGEDG